MRKNGINCQLRPIEGGICAPEGFKAGGVSSGIKCDDEIDMAMIVAERKCRTACVYSQLSTVGAPIPITKKHLNNGLAQAILVNGGVANVFLPDGEKLADEATRLVERYHNISYDDVLIASTGEIGKPLSYYNFERGVVALRVHMGKERSFSKAATSALSSVNDRARDFSFAFDLGDFPCKIGGIFKGKTHVCPNMATTLVFLTTDVNITQEMLSRGLAAEVRETLNMLALDGEPSPNDMACIMTTGKAGNSLIDCVDSEYAKFTRALRAILTWICEEIARGSEGHAIRCRVLGARSKPLARMISKRLASCDIIKRAIIRNGIDVDGILYVLSEFEGIDDYSRVEIFIQSGEKKVVLFEDERKIFLLDNTIREALNAEDVTLCVRIGRGNYASTSYGTALFQK